jgi:hypothetical protein
MSSAKTSMRRQTCCPVATVNSIQLAYSRESGDARAYGRHPQTDLVGGHRLVPIKIANPLWDAPRIQGGAINLLFLYWQQLRIASQKHSHSRVTTRTHYCPTSVPVRQIRRIEEGSDCLVGQARIGCHGRLSRRIALRIVVCRCGPKFSAHHPKTVRAKLLNMVYSPQNVPKGTLHSETNPARFHNRDKRYLRIRHGF